MSEHGNARCCAPGAVLGAFTSAALSHSCACGPSWIVRGGRQAPFAALAGIVNATPDSFSDGGRYAAPEAAVAHALTLLDEGAGMVDLGAESTRPFAAPVGADAEAARLLPVLEGVRGARPDALVSVDTYKASTARQALDLGAHIINDVSACAFDPALLEVLVSYKPGYVLMHSQGRPTTMQVAPVYTSVVDEVLAFFESKLAELVRAGLPEDRIVLDPGVGFGKRAEHSLAVLRHVERFMTLGRPLYVGLSMKSLFGDTLQLSVEERGEATRLALVLLARQGVRYHRVHHVAQARRALLLARTLTSEGLAD